MVTAAKSVSGNRTRHGADTQQVLASVVRTAYQRQLDLAPLIITMLRSSSPVVPHDAPTVAPVGSTRGPSDPKPRQ